MHQIQFTIMNPKDISEIYTLATQSQELDIIEEKNFNGDLTTITLYVSLAANVFSILMPLLKTLIKTKKISSLKIDGNKIELMNVSEKLIEDLLNNYHFQASEQPPASN